MVPARSLRRGWCQRWQRCAPWCGSKDGLRAGGMQLHCQPAASMQVGVPSGTAWLSPAAFPGGASTADGDHGTIMPRCKTKPWLLPGVQNPLCFTPVLQFWGRIRATCSHCCYTVDPPVSPPFLLHLPAAQKTGREEAGCGQPCLTRWSLLQGKGGERLGELGHACGVPPPHRHPPAATLGARMSCAQHPVAASGSGCIFHSLFIELEISAARGDPGRGGWREGEASGSSGTGSPCLGHHSCWPGNLSAWGLA